MSAIGDERAAIADKLTAAGLPATLDPTTVPPFVLVGAPDIDPAGVGGWSLTLPVHVVVAPPGDAEALDALLELTELTLRTLGPGAARPTTYGDRQAPAYELVVRRDVTNPDC